MTPFLPRPTSAEFDELLRRYRSSRLPVVGVGRRWGPFMPQIREAAEEAPRSDLLDEDLGWYLGVRCGWKKLPEGVTVENRDHVRRVRELHNASLSTWHPKRHPAVAMWASSARTIGLHEDAQIAKDLLHLKGSVVPPSKRDLGSDRRRFRTLDAIVASGDRLWSLLGAWPWAAFPDGHMPSEWWTEEDAAMPLFGFCDEMARRAQSVAAALEPDFVVPKATPAD